MEMPGPEKEEDELKNVVVHRDTGPGAWIDDTKSGVLDILAYREVIVFVLVVQEL